jgi:hypothetical protein
LAAIECFLFQYTDFYIWYVINDVLTWRREINLIDNSFVGVFWLLGTLKIFSWLATVLIPQNVSFCLNRDVKPMALVTALAFA